MEINAVVYFGGLIFVLFILFCFYRKRINIKREYTNGRINKESVKLDYCHHCIRYQDNCPYNSDGSPIVACDKYVINKYKRTTSLKVQNKKQVHTVESLDYRDYRRRCPCCGSVKAKGVYDNRVQCK